MICVAKVSIFCILGVSLVGATINEQTINPVTRVVELLQGLAKQVEKEGKVEEGLYEDFVCWGRSVIDQKTASNAEAKSRITELEQLVADLDAGRIELTSERSDLEKDIAQLTNDMETATAMRDKERDDFDQAKEEMETAIKALDDAIRVLAEATKDHKEGVLLAINARVKDAEENGGTAALVERQAALSKAVELGEHFLQKADAAFLRRVLFGEVPKVDMKKLNRKATFKMNYKARSFKIQKTLQEMKENFKKNLNTTATREEKEEADYKALSGTKAGQLDTARTALRNMDGENGEKSVSKQDAQDELKSLTDQVNDDSRFIEETKKALADKAAGWKTRSELRTAELGGISKAIYILHNDDAQNLFKKSFESHAQTFLQVRQTSRKAKMQQGQKAADTLRNAALRSGDKSLLALASLAERPSVKGKFDPIISKIDDMVDTLKDQEEEDLKVKQRCEEDRMKNTKNAISASRRMDGMTDSVTKLEGVIAECVERNEKLCNEHNKTTAAREDAERIRIDEHNAWVQNDKDDEEAAKTVKRASTVLAKFQNDAAFVQKSKKAAGGDAPPPPPPTWEGGYGGKQGELQGIVAIMDMVYEDIVKDMSDAEADEKVSSDEYVAFMDESESRLDDLNTAIERNLKQEGSARTAKVNMEKKRRRTHDYLNRVIDTIKDADPNCEYYEVNYPMRVENRQIEMDGLYKAKAILSGGVFNEGPDPNREIKPGDAAAAVLLQSRSRR